MFDFRSLFLCVYISALMQSNRKDVDFIWNLVKFAFLSTNLSKRLKGSDKCRTCRGVNLLLRCGTPRASVGSEVGTFAIYWVPGRLPVGPGPFRTLFGVNISVYTRRLLSLLDSGSVSAGFYGPAAAAFMLTCLCSSCFPHKVHCKQFLMSSFSSCLFVRSCCHPMLFIL